MKLQHYPVMVKEVADIFAETGKQWFIDGTLGMGGHTAHLLQRFPDARVIGLDVDEQSLQQARHHLESFGPRVEFHHLNFTTIFQSLDLSGKDISGLLVDPGISVYQLKEAARGFSHTLDARLDMRKDLNSTLTAHDIINHYTEKQLQELFETYGEVRGARDLAKKISEARLFNRIDTTGQLTQIIENYYHWFPKRGKTHPAATIFQALRIAVNHELDGIYEFIMEAARHLPVGARLVFLSFHSVEDRLTKKAFLTLQKEKKIRIIKPFPMFPSDEEVATNLPSRSAKLRAGEIL